MPEVTSFIIGWIMHEFWLILIYNLSEDRRLDDVTI